MAKANLKTLAQGRMIPLEFMIANGFSQGLGGIEFQTYGDDGKAGRVGVRKYDLGDRPEKGGFSWKQGAEPMFPAGFNCLKPEDEEVLLVEGATDWVTARYMGIAAIGFHGANVVPKKYLQAVARGKKVLWVGKEPDEGGDSFVESITKDLRDLASPPEVRVIEFPEETKDLSALFCNCDGSKDEFLRRFNLLKSNAKRIEVNGTVRTVYNGNEITVDLEKMEITLTDKEQQTSPVSNFVAQIISQKYARCMGLDKRQYTVLVRGKIDGILWQKEIVMSEREFTSPSAFLVAIEKSVGVKATVFASGAAQIIRMVAAFIANKDEQELLQYGGLYGGRYILGCHCVTSEDVSVFKEPLTLASDFDKTSTLGFKVQNEVDASNTMASFIVNSSSAYHRETWPLSTAVIPLVFALQTRLPFVSDVRGGLEIVGDQGDGKTEFCLNIGYFFATSFNEEKMWHTKDTLAALEAGIGMSNGAPLFINDIKRIENPSAFAERVQNIIDGGVYTKMVDGKPGGASPYKGLVISNGQEALSAHSSSFSSRVISFSVKKGKKRDKFREIQKFREDISGITPWIVKELLSESGQLRLQYFFEEEFNFLVETSKADFSIERAVRFGALAIASIEFVFDFLEKRQRAVSRKKLSRLKLIAAETARRQVLANIKRIEKADNIHKLFVALIQGVEAGALFFGEMKPDAAASTSICLGPLPNMQEGTLWINYGALLNYVKRIHSNSELGGLSSNVLVRELERRGYLKRSSGRPTTRIKEKGEWGWKIKFEKNKMLADFIASLMANEVSNTAPTLKAVNDSDDEIKF